MATIKQSTKQPLIGFKAFNKGLKSAYSNYQFEVGKEYEIEGELELCANGFHFCRKPLDVDNYYGVGNKEYALIEALGDIIDGSDKSVTSKIRIVKMLTRKELELYEDKVYKYHSKNDMPARIDEDGNMYWYRYNKIHRDHDKPAIVMKNGTMHWFIDGEHVRENGKPKTVGYQGQQYFMGDIVPMPRLHYIT